MPKYLITVSGTVEAEGDLGATSHRIAALLAYGTIPDSFADAALDVEGCLELSGIERID